MAFILNETARTSVIFRPKMLLPNLNTKQFACAPVFGKYLRINGTGSNRYGVTPCRICLEHEKAVLQPQNIVLQGLTSSSYPIQSFSLWSWSKKRKQYVCFGEACSHFSWDYKKRVRNVDFFFSALSLTAFLAYTELDKKPPVSFVNIFALRTSLVYLG